MRASQLLAAVVALSSLSAAWPDMFDDMKANALGDFAGVKNILYGRDNNDDSSSSASPSATEAPKSSDSDAKSTAPASSGDAKSGDDKATSTAKETNKATGSQKGSGSGAAKPTAAGNRTVTFDPLLPAGGISMITPAPISGTQYYKVGDYVTFAWNYTSLSATPSAIDILASCSANQATYTLAVNQSVSDQNTILWDTKGYQASASVPLLTEMYTLIIYDADSSISATAGAGYLAVQSQFQFGMYTPQPYVNWTDFKCANCNPNAAFSAFESLTLKAMLITCGTTIGSLIYFAFSFGVL